ncbi:hypothetical protein MtrunA17_Chr5g0423971 [Medicago truncatula]|uniref:Transposase (putative) gypsy type domain-containing protein n=1 Tax=Medicago truncatula TaxID=3880 RepID=A0A396HYZ1_MEDTR|nr:hypothetical protein MtrunA17_Chr5g0423971 [Medicago truncatula]
MYEAVFQEVGFRLPFSPFQVSVFEWMELRPSQLRPDSFAYMIPFELVCRFMRLLATRELFFTIFTIQRGLDKDGGQNCVPFCQRKALFEIFNCEATKFQKRFFLVRPRTERALKSVLKVTERPHEDVGVVSRRVLRFPFYWSKDHFKHVPEIVRHSYTALSERNKMSFARILEFVHSFSRLKVVTEDGNPVLDLRGNQVTIPRVIDTRSLVLSSDPMALLGKMFHIRFLMNKASQKVVRQSSGNGKRSERRDQTADAGFPARVHDDPIEEEEVPL